jgi:hypothetical protein
MAPAGQPAGVSGEWEAKREAAEPSNPATSSGGQPPDMAGTVYGLNPGTSSGWQPPDLAGTVYGLSAMALDQEGLFDSDDSDEEAGNTVRGT